MKKLIVDCGATKTEWCILEEGNTRTVKTPGFNLAHTPEHTLREMMETVVPQIGPGVEEIHFFAAGLVDASPVDLGQWFPGARIEYASDMLGAARAVCGKRPGVAAILGTGANTCSYDGENIGWKVNCGGFIVGDEGSASVLGKMFISDFIKGCLPQEMADAFAATHESSYPAIVKSIYRAEAPARYLGSLAPFVVSYYDKLEYARNLVDTNFRNLFERTLRRYDPSLPVGVVGGFGYACKDILRSMGAEYGISFSQFLASPMAGLVDYYAV